MEKIHISICDDEQIIRDHLTGLVQEWYAGKHAGKARAETHAETRAKACEQARAKGNCPHFACEITHFENAEAFLFAYDDDKSTDILLLDIQMKEMDGMELARKVRKDNQTVQIIFITGYLDYIAEGYDVNAVHYLLKPVDKNKLFSALDKAVENRKTPAATITIESDGEIHLLPVAGIIYIEALNHDLEIHTKNGLLRTKMPLYKMEELLGAFIKTHRSFLVNPAFIRKITRTDVFLDNGQTLPLSRRMYADVNRAMMRFVVS